MPLPGIVAAIGTAAAPAVGRWVTKRLTPPSKGKGPPPPPPTKDAAMADKLADFYPNSSYAPAAAAGDRGIGWRVDVGFGNPSPYPEPSTSVAGVPVWVLVLVVGAAFLMLLVRK